jgi:hypothetical protein
MVRSEGAEDVCSFNSLPTWAKSRVHFPAIGAFQAQRLSIIRSRVLQPDATPSPRPFATPKRADVLLELLPWPNKPYAMP